MKIEIIVVPGKDEAIESYIPCIFTNGVYLIPIDCLGEVEDAAKYENITFEVKEITI